MIGSILRMRYELVALQYEGPLWDSYAARDRIQAKDVTIRIPHEPLDQDPGFAKNVQGVLEKYGKVRHPAIEVIFETDEHEGKNFLVAEHTKGSILGERLRKLAPFSVPVSVMLAISILEGLDALHAEGKVHGDLGIHSIMVQIDGSAKLLMPGQWETYSYSPSIPPLVLPSMATYLAPEISKGAVPSPQSDCYSVGVLLYQFIVGRAPFLADHPTAMAMRHESEPVPSMRAQNPAVPMVLDEILKKSLSKDPKHRYVHAGEMLSDLRILHDALRFGRTLSWPIRPGSQSNDTRQVAPTMSAIKREKKKPEEEEQYARDVPRWLFGIFLACVLALVGFVGAFMYFNFSKPKQVTVPSLANLTVAEAQALLKQSGLGMRISRREPSEQIPEEHVMSTSPEAGTKVAQNSKVSLRVSSGSNFVEVPDITKHTADEARSMLGAVGLKLDDDFSKVPDPKIEEGKIVSQDPPSRKRVLKSSLIRVKVSGGPVAVPENAPADKPVATANYIYTLRFKLSGLKEAVDVRIEVVDSEGNSDIILNERREPNESVEVQARTPGNKATFRIFYNGELVRELTKEATAKESAEGEANQQ